jgi:hypothetical protein
VKNYKTYTPEEVLAALKELDSQYLSPEMFVLIHGVPQLVERLRDLEDYRAGVQVGLRLAMMAPDDQEATAERLVT